MPQSKPSNFFWVISFVLGLAVVTAGGLFVWAKANQVEYKNGEAATTTATTTTEVLPRTPMKTPDSVRALYLTGWAAGHQGLRTRVVGLIDSTEANAVVIDVKDYSGRISWIPSEPLLVKIGAGENRIADIEGLMADLRRRNIYTIARISVFQDKYLSTKRPDLAVQSLATGGIWKDRKGVSWLDPGSREVWEYTLAVAREARAVGFDELNFDYIRFPSDGNMKDVNYRFYDEVNQTKPVALERFFRYLAEQTKPLGIPISADLFGMTTTNSDDLGIGQVLERALPHFDYVAPMIYPSHYPPGFHDYKNPASVPYEIITIAMKGAIAKTNAASSTVKKLRPWLKDFDLGADYTPDMIKAQKRALYDLGLNSWMMWDPSNNYTAGGLDPEPRSHIQ